MSAWQSTTHAWSCKYHLQGDRPIEHASTWRLRDSLTAAALFIASAAFVLWQNAHVAVLWDLGYLLDSSCRISLGQIPYRDFPFAHAPLTFLLHATIIHIFGRIYWPHIACAAVEAGAASIITWRILLAVVRPLAERAWIIAAILSAPLCVLSIYAVYPHPIYDSDCILLVLLSLYLMAHAVDRPWRNAAAGALCIIPLFTKQNIGLLFLASVLFCVGADAIIHRFHRSRISSQLFFLAGAATMLATVLIAIHYTAALHNYVYWTITFAAQRRLPGLSVLAQDYCQHSLLWAIPAAIAAIALLHASPLKNPRWSRALAYLLLAAPFLWTIFSFILTSDPDDRADQLLSLWPHVLLLGIALALSNLRPHKCRDGISFRWSLPILLLATIHGTFLSQQLWGSTYAIWPLLLLLVGSLLTQVPAIATPLAATISFTLILCGGIYATSHERLDYIHLNDDSQPQIAYATLPQLHSLATPGTYIPSFEELIRFTKTEIPADDGILLLPGEGPFYFATGRSPKFPILLFDPATDPYTPQQTLLVARAQNIRWLIVTRTTQLTATPKPDLPEVLAALQQEFIPYRTLSNYDIYRHR